MEKKAYVFGIKGAAIFAEGKAKGDKYTFPRINYSYKFAYVTEDGLGVALLGDGVGAIALVFEMPNGEIYTPGQILEKLEKCGWESDSVDIPEEKDVEEAYAYVVDGTYETLCSFYAEAGAIEVYDDFVAVR